MAEPQSPPFNLGSNWSSTLSFMHLFHGLPNYDLSRLKAVESIFKPAPEDSEARYASWIGISANSLSGKLGVKTYFNPEIHGANRAMELLEKCFKILGMHKSWLDLEARVRHLHLRDVISYPFVGLDLTRDRDGRLKIYIGVNNWSSVRILTEGLDGYDPDCWKCWVENFIGRNRRMFYPRHLLVHLKYDEKKLDEQPAAALHIPVEYYCQSNTKTIECLQSYLSEYQLKALKSGIGYNDSKPINLLINWVSVTPKPSNPAQPEITCYISPRIYAT